MTHQTIITQRNKNKNYLYFPIGASNNIQKKIWLMLMFIEHIAYEKNLDISTFNSGGCNDFRIDYGDLDENYYVMFSDDFISKIYGYKNSTIDIDKIPSIKVSYKNFDYILKRWNLIQKQKPIYLIISQDESDWINLESKEKLSTKEQVLVNTFDTSTCLYQ